MKKIICTGVAAAMLIGCVSVSAFPGMGMGNPMKGFGRPFKAQTENFELPEKPAMPELTEEQKAQMQEKAVEDLNKQLEEGKITQEEYDDMLTGIENGEMPFFGNPVGKMPFFGNPMGRMPFGMSHHGKAPEGEFKAPGGEFKAPKGEFKAPKGEFKAPEMPAMPELTEEQKAEIQEKAIEDLNKQLEEGKITQEEYDDRLAKIENGNFPPRFNGKKGGPRHPFGPGFEKPENITSEDYVEE